jgi:hypothetical protein
MCKLDNIEVTINRDCHREPLRSKKFLVFCMVGFMFSFSLVRLPNRLGID